MWNWIYWDNGIIYTYFSTRTLLQYGPFGISNSCGDISDIIFILNFTVKQETD